MTSGREVTLPWVFDALKTLGGTAQLVQVAEYIWDNHSSTITSDKKMLLTWQYEMRWAATQLRKQGIMNKNTASEPWSLSTKGMGMKSL